MPSDIDKKGVSYLDQEGKGPWLVAHGGAGLLHPCIGSLGGACPLHSQSLQIMLTHHPPQPILGAPIV